jgi:hypothetical protein
MLSVGREVKMEIPDNRSSSAMAIIVSKSGGNAVKLDKSSFEDEDYLQQFICQNPDSVPLYDIKEDIKLLILAREFPVGSGAIDALGVDREQAFD